MVRYFHLHNVVLRIMGFGDFEARSRGGGPPGEGRYSGLAYRTYGRCLLAYYACYSCLEIAYSARALRDGADIQSTFLALVLGAVHSTSAMKMGILARNREGVRRVVETLERDAKRFATALGANEKVERDSIRFTKVLTLTFLGMGTSFLTLFGIVAFTQDLHSARKKPREVNFGVYVPWDCAADPIFYATFFACYATVVTFGGTIMILDTFFASMLAHLAGQFRTIGLIVADLGDKALDLLARGLDEASRDELERNWRAYRMFRPTMTRASRFVARKKFFMGYFADEQFDEAMFECLREVVRYHQTVIEMVNDLQVSYRHGFFLQTMTSLYVTGLVLVQTTQNNSIVSFSMAFVLSLLLSVLIQLFIQTYSANEMTLQAADIAGQAFSSSWYEMQKNNKRVGKLIALLIQRAQKPVFVTSGYFSPMSNDLFVRIIRSSFQIFTLITTTMKD